jgi:hypothetical protein
MVSFCMNNAIFNRPRGVWLGPLESVSRLRLACRRVTVVDGVMPTELNVPMKSTPTPDGAPNLLRKAAFALLACGAFGAAQPALFASDAGVAAVSSQVSPDYTRAMLPDGSLKPETYTFGNGGRMPSSQSDDSIDKLSFLDVAKVISGPLADQNYVPVEDRDPDKTRLLIMVYWGSTSGTTNSTQSFAYENLQSMLGSEQGKAPAPPPPTGGARSGGTDFNAMTRSSQEDNITGAMATVGLEEKERGKVDIKNAMLLGYDSELALTSTTMGATAMQSRRDDLISEIEEERYFIVLMAYDFDALWKRKQHKLLWVTRFSIRARGTNFTEVLPAMVKQASQYFGQSTNGLLRKPLPLGRVDVGEVKSLGVVPEK